MWFLYYHDYLDFICGQTAKWKMVLWFTPKVVITWSRLAETKFCPVLSGSRQCYKLFINYILGIHVKSFIPAKRGPTFVLPGSRFAGTKFSHVIALACLSGMKKLINSSLWKNPKKYISKDRSISFVFLRRIWGQSVTKKCQQMSLCDLSILEKVDTAED